MYDGTSPARPSMKYLYEVIRGDGPVRLEPCESSAHAGELITFDKPIPDGRVMLSNTFGNMSDEQIDMPFSPLEKGQVFVVSFSDTLKITSDRLFTDDNSVRNHELAMEAEKTKLVRAGGDHGGWAEAAEHGYC